MRKRSREAIRFGLILALGVWGVGRSAGASPDACPPPPSGLTVEAYGDSVTAGFLSATDASSPPALTEIKRIFNDLFQYIAFKDKTRLPRNHAPDLAWPKVLGEKLKSRGEAVEVLNLARSGDHMSDLVRQVSLSKAIATPTIAFFFLGHNDMCNTDSLNADQLAKKLAGELERGLDDWDKKHEGSTAYLMPLGDIARVYETLKDHTWYRGQDGSFTCQHSWLRYFPYCPAHAHRLGEKTLTTYLAPRMLAVNRAIEIAATKFADQSRRNRYVFLDKVLKRPFEPTFFAIDCYHLSPRGQREVADDVLQSIGK